MGTISDKLMRIINTKEDIRQALISKGYDVPTSIPFKEYAKMILDLPCKADSFPDIEGIVARYSASGLTNEQMAANPVWVDKTSNGHDLQLKNLAWGGMSGVGGYADNWNSSADWAINSYWVNSYTDHKLQFIKASSVVQARSNNIYNAENVYKNILNVNGLTEAVNKGSVKALRINAVDPITSKAIKIFSFDTDGVIQISFDDVLQDYYVAYFLSGNNTNDIDITIEQLPLYPGALVFDGVDDYGTCDNFPILTKEKGYTVVALRQWISMGEGISGLVSNVKNWFNDGAFVLEYNSNNATNKFVNRPVSFGNVNIEMDLPNNFTYQTSKSYKGVPITTGSFKGTNSLFVGKLNNIIGNCSNVAIWELVFLDHDATEEELTKIKDYFVKTYPWLFPNQAWTVTGKTNEDEDRATIANITGNGNDLVLSNFGFAEGSGYGLYKLNFNNWFANSGSGNVNIVNVVNPHKIVLEQSQEAVGVFFLGKNVSYSGELKISVSNKPSDIELSFGSSALGKVVLNEGINIVKINPVNTSIGFFTNKAFEAQNIIIEQIPEYEGYLITDGVDDTGRAVGLTISKDFTLVGEWILFSKTSVNAGLSIHPQIHIFNRPEAIQIMFRTAGKTLPVKSLKAICSDGRCYDENWSELKINVGEFTDNKGTLFVASNGTNYAQIAFKNLGIYNNQILSKEDCIKAYNYLQTLKAK